jgi:hypothetical protein
VRTVRPPAMPAPEFISQLQAQLTGITALRDDAA